MSGYSTADGNGIAIAVYSEALLFVFIEHLSAKNNTLVALMEFPIEARLNFHYRANL